MENSFYHPLGTGQYGHHLLFGGVPDKTINNIVSRVNFHTVVDEDAFVRALYYSVKNLPFCRLRLHEKEDGELVQYLSDEEPHDIEIVDFTHLSEEEIDAEVKKWCKQAFDNDCLDVQLFMMRIMRMPEGKHSFFLRAHHIIMDSYGIMTLVRYLDKTYSAILTGKELPKPGILPWKVIEQDWEYCESKRYEEDKAWWRKQFEPEPHFASPNPVGSPEYIAGKNYGRGQTLEQLAGTILFRRFPKAFVDSINKAATEKHISAQLFFFLGLRSFLGHMSETDDVTINTMAARRSTLLQKQCGLSRVNDVPFRSVIPERVSFDKALEMLDLAQKELYRHVNVFIPEITEIRNEMHDTPLGCTYCTTDFTYQPYFDLETTNLEFDVHPVATGMAWPALYMIIQPQDNSGDLWAAYNHSIDYVSDEQIDKLHRFVLNFVSDGIKNGEESIADLIARNL